MAIYFDRERYDSLVKALMALKPCELSGTLTEDQVKIALGEGGDIWTTRIAEDDASSACGR